MQAISKSTGNFVHFSSASSSLSLSFFPLPLLTDAPSVPSIPSTATPVVDSPSPLANSSSRPVNSSFREIFAACLAGEEHLWMRIKPAGGLGTVVSLYAMGLLFAGSLAALCWLPSRSIPGVEATTWSAMWWDGGYVYTSVVVRFLADWMVTIFVLWPVGAIITLAGIAYFVATHTTVAALVFVPLSLLYSTFSTRTFSISSHLSLPYTSPLARIIDYLTLPVLVHLIVAFLPLPQLHLALPFLYALDANSLLLVFGTSFPHLFFTLISLLISFLFAAREASAPASLKDKSDSKTSTSTELAEMKKEIEMLKAMLHKA
jgi:hypothetical protein